ncbi:winged helix-turn-helix transcriptional regulator [Sphingobacterium yanglingense]|uniref:HxlR family transcriptional regulator n=1 Tax=Sphingobacterium yanglingense TaxID=1437280 RepID=A0A4R6W559_9SPHI|nr:helix-turn-helix domain-containing protein [Sphingobacterium yanglingense]TDQ73888.1 HxlR family transcriptional regulator [Sphingobacterium yanglingense]
MKKKLSVNHSEICKTRITAIKDTMEILSGKWKFHILGTLLETDRMRFMDLLREVEGIGSKMLSKELQDMEINHLVTRTVQQTKPITVVYEVTEYGKTLGPIIDEIAKWGISYRSSLHSPRDRETA